MGNTEFDNSIVDKKEIATSIAVDNSIVVGVKCSYKYSSYMNLGRDFGNFENFDIAGNKKE